MSMLILEGRTISVSGPFHGRASFRLARRGRVMGRIEAAWPVCWPNGRIDGAFAERNLPEPVFGRGDIMKRSEEHTSELQSLMRISYAVFCLKKKKKSISQLTYVTEYITTIKKIKHR